MEKYHSEEQLVEFYRCRCLASAALPRYFLAQQCQHGLRQERPKNQTNSRVSVKKDAENIKMLKLCFV